jgi:hypothetical protein
MAQLEVLGILEVRGDRSDPWPSGPSPITSFRWIGASVLIEPVGARSTSTGSESGGTMAVLPTDPLAREPRAILRLDSVLGRRDRNHREQWYRNQEAHGRTP